MNPFPKANKASKPLQPHSRFDEETIIRNNIIACLKETRGNVTAAAILLGVDRRTLQRRATVKMGLRLADYR